MYAMHSYIYPVGNNFKTLRRFGASSSICNKLRCLKFQDCLKNILRQILRHLNFLDNIEL